MGLSPSAISEAFAAACLAELEALKPGNVHRFAGGHGMDVAVFERSADVSAPAIAAAGATVGARVLGAVEATWAAVAMNTNLGILLLCAPLAAAAERLGPPASGEAAAARLRADVAGVLAALTADDAADVFRAIASASPGGLGTEEAHDVRAPPSIGLVEAMRLAAPRDLVARQYAGGFADVFGTGLPALAAARAAGETGMWPAIQCFLAFAAAYPDSHVARKYGADAALRLQADMQALRNRLFALDDPAEREAALLVFDARLKAERLNPGTSADLTVASLFAEELARRLEECRLG